MKLHAILLLPIALASVGTRTVADASSSVIGKMVAEFTLRDSVGGSHGISSGKIVVVTFLGTECPLAKLYAARLNQLSKDYADRGVIFLGVDSNRQDSVTEMSAFVRRMDLSFPLLKDVGNKVADSFQSERTPEVFVLDADRVVRYHGRVDDQYGVGFIRPQATSHDLKNALDAILEGKEVPVAETEAPGCLIGRVREVSESGDVTYCKQIARIFQDRCVECHRDGEIAPFSLTSYEDSAGWADMIVEVVREQRMPPWHASAEHGDFSNDCRLTEAEKEMVYAWAKAGAPEGDPKDLPAPRSFAKGWRIPEPDLVVEMPEEYTVQAEGEVPYQYFVMDPKLTEDKWVVAAECLAGNPAVVHHNIAFVVPPEIAKDLPAGHFGAPERGDREQARGGRVPPGAPADINKRIAIMRSWFTNYLVAMAPGAPPEIHRPGTAKRIPAGSKIVFQMHYTPVGTVQKDRSRIGLKFTKAEDVKHEVVTRNVIEQRFEIPPHDGNYPVDGTLRFREDSLIVDLFPHMHLRGKSFKYTARYPDGREEVLLDVPRYDFGWQNIYHLREPKFMPKGTVLYCLAHFDNSEQNLSNPDPSDTVRFGDQTWEEMMIGFFNMTRAREGTYFESGKTRLARFEEMSAEGKATIGSEVRKRGELALESDEAFDRWWDEANAILPQVDRIDVSVADGLQFRYALIAQVEELPSTMKKLKELPPQLNVAGPALGLYQYAIKRQTVVNNDPTQVKGMEMQFLTRILPSSVHVPIRYRGKPATVNFWSTDKAAFSPEAVKVAEALVETLTPVVGAPQASRSERRLDQNR